MKKDEPHLPGTADKSRHFRCSQEYASSMLTASHIVSTTPLYHYYYTKIRVAFQVDKLFVFWTKSKECPKM